MEHDPDRPQRAGHHPGGAPMISQLLTYLPFIISLVLGVMTGVLIFRKSEKPPLVLFLLLSAGLGLGISVFLSFLGLVIMGQIHPVSILTLHAVYFLTILTFNVMDIKKGLKPFHLILSRGEVIEFLIILLLTLPMWYLIHFYAYGGWDAWSTWNFKAKFLFQTGDNWQNMFDPLLWRASPHYPIFLPLLNVWSWIFQASPNYYGPSFTAYVFALLIAGTLTCGLRFLTRSNAAIWTAIILLSMLFYSKLALSQYADNLVAFYLLASLFCLMTAKIKNNIRYLIFSAIFMGCLTFTKTEGLLLTAMLLALTPLYLWYKNSVKIPRRFFAAFFGFALLACLPAIIFKLFFAPSNMTFINGLTSQTDPITWPRVKMLIAFYALEVAAPLFNVFALFIDSLKGTDYICKWNGLWLILMIGVGIGWKKCFNAVNIIIPVLISAYMVIITAYYIVNTHFEIDWWLQVSLNRILSGILPAVIFWIFHAIWQHDA